MPPASTEALQLSGHEFALKKATQELRILSANRAAHREEGGEQFDGLPNLIRQQERRDESSENEAKLSMSQRFATAGETGRDGVLRRVKTKPNVEGKPGSWFRVRD